MTGYPDYVAPIYDVNSRGIQNPSVYRATSYFPQPQGSIYMINASSDVANVPVGSGISAAICMGEGVLHLKTVQNGSPAIVSYRISPLGVAETQNSAPAASQQPVQPTPAPAPQQDSKILEVLENLNKRLQSIEQAQSQQMGSAPVPPQKTTQGGKPEWQL